MITFGRSLRVAACLGVTFVPAVVASSCSLPTGIDFGSGPCPSSSCVDVSAFSGLPAQTCVLEAIQAVGAVKPGLSGVETPVVNHWIASNIGQVYSAMAAYEPDALELWGRKPLSDARRRCSTGIPNSEFEVHRQVTLAYTVLWVYGSVHVWKDPVGGAEVPLRALAQTWGIDFDLCDLDRTQANDKVDSCNDRMTPWGLAIELKEEIFDWFTRDGWNRNGDLGGVVHNRIPYSDWRSKTNRYAPVNDAFELTNDKRWQPLLEHDDVGFLFHQAHVTPHIGETAVSIFLEDAEICSRSGDLDDPKYDLDVESDLVLERTRDLTETSKARVELFNDKLASLSPLAGKYLAVYDGKPSDSFGAIIAQAANIHAIREATILAWRSKVEHDLIRPSSYIRNTDPDVSVFSYGGPDVGGPTDILRGQWQGYKRVMPHAEFPSGSSCVCLAYAEAMMYTTGTDTFASPLTIVRPAGSSSVEENMPSTDQPFAFDSWTDISEQCGDSRLDGGMHFRAAVTGGRSLCGGVGTQVAEAFTKLSQGIAPDYLNDFDNPSGGEEVRCADYNTQNACCTNNFEDCITWCGDTKDSCEECTADVYWLPYGPQPNCLARWATCTDDVDGCCDGLECIGGHWYKQCLPEE